MLKILGLLVAFVVCSCEEVLVVEHSVEVELVPIKAPVTTTTTTYTSQSGKEYKSMAGVIEEYINEIKSEDLKKKELESDSSEEAK